MSRLAPLAATLALSACVAAFPSAPPVGRLLPAPSVDVSRWVASLVPTGHTALRFNWVLNRDEAKGKGSFAIAPRDSVLLHYAGTFGFGAGSVFVLGDSAIWADPKDDIEKLVPNYELLWGLVGVARPPRAGWKVDGSQDATRTTWRYVRESDTTTYLLWTANGVVSLQTQVTIDGKRVGQVVTVFDALHHPLRSRLDTYQTPARLDLNFYKGAAIAFDREMWSAPNQ